VLLHRVVIVSGIAVLVQGCAINSRSPITTAQKPSKTSIKKVSAYKKTLSWLHYQVANSYYNRHQFKDSLHSYQQAVQYDPSNVTAKIGLGFLYDEMGDSKRALSIFKPLQLTTAKDYPENYRIYWGLGKALYNLKRYKEAIVPLQLSAHLTPANKVDYKATISDLLSEAYSFTKQYHKALASIERAIALNPKEPNYYVGLGVIFYRLYDDDKSIDAFRQAIKLDRDCSDAYLNLGNLYAAHKDYIKASGCYKEVLRINPQDKRAARNLRYCQSRL
jgi:tetratricopeptide (TPR) repeat protein